MQKVVLTLKSIISPEKNDNVNESNLLCSLENDESISVSSKGTMDLNKSLSIGSNIYNIESESSGSSQNIKSDIFQVMILKKGFSS